MVKAIIFDLDNTLVDFMKMKHSAIAAATLAMIDAGLEMKKEDVEEKINAIYNVKGIEYQKVFDDLLQNVIQPQKNNSKILAAGVVAYRRAREASLVAYPHVYQTLLTLFRKGYKLGVVSDAPTKEAWLRLAYLNLHHIFDAVVTFEDTHSRKPDPAPFKKALELLNVKPSEAVMVGDWPERDMGGAKLVGMATVFAKYGYAFGGGVPDYSSNQLPLTESEKIKHTKPDYIIEDMAELVGIIEQI